jgi:hypothetical protein
VTFTVIARRQPCVISRGDVFSILKALVPLAPQIPPATTPLQSRFSMRGNVMQYIILRLWSATTA